jgi:hypothetical protein
MISTQLSEITGRSSNIDEFKLVAESLPKLSLEEGPWLAGGSIRRTLSSLPLDEGDFDIFFKDEDQYNTFKPFFTDGPIKLPKSPNSETYSLHKNDKDYKIQLINTYYFKSATDLLESFDFTICQFATDLNNVLFNPLSLIDITSRRLVVNKIMYPVASMRRVIKYSKQGYYMCEGALQEFLKEVASKPDLITTKAQYID